MDGVHVKVVSERAGHASINITLSTYAAIQAYAQAVAEAKTTDMEKVAATLRSHPWETVIGKIAFDSKGDLTSSTYVWYVFKNGKYAEAGM